MTLPLQTLVRLLFLASAVGAAQAAGVARVGPSDCRPRDADSTCAGVVAAAPVEGPPISPVDVLYDGPLAGVPPTGYAYWGFDFLSDQMGVPSPVRPDQFINRSSVPVTISLSFTIPTSHPCTRDCLPGVEFEVDAGWYKVDPPAVVSGDRATVTNTFVPGQGYGWAIGLWQATNPRLRVTTPRGARATMQDVGLPDVPSIADEIAAVQTLCGCADSTTATCSYGSHFTNGLLGPWSQRWQNYQRAGAFTECSAER